MKPPSALLMIFLSLLSGDAISGAEYPSVPVDLTPIRLSAHAYYVQGGSGIATDNYGFVSNAAFVARRCGARPAIVYRPVPEQNFEARAADRGKIEISTTFKC